MIAAMSFPRMLAAGALLVIGAALVSVPACIVANDLENGQECLRDQECASGQCTAGRCIGQPSGDSGAPKTDTATGGDTTPVTDSASDAPAEASGDTAESGTDAADAAEAATDTADGAASD
jgi:hypothetical protein